MRVAVACDGLVVAPYFVQTTSYMIYNVERGIIVGQLVELIKTIGIDAFIVGRIDNETAVALRTSGTDLVTNAKDDPLLAAQGYLSSVFTAVAD